MSDRYPYLRLITDAGNVIAGLAAVLTFVLAVALLARAGLFLALLLGAVVAWLAYMAAMARVEAARAILQIEDHLREILARDRLASSSANDSPRPSAEPGVEK